MTRARGTFCVDCNSGLCADDIEIGTVWSQQDIYGRTDSSNTSKDRRWAAYVVTEWQTIRNFLVTLLRRISGSNSIVIGDESTAEKWPRLQPLSWWTIRWRHRRIDISAFFCIQTTFACMRRRLTFCKLYIFAANDWKTAIDTLILNFRDRANSWIKKLSYICFHQRAPPYYSNRLWGWPLLHSTQCYIGKRNLVTRPDLQSIFERWSQHVKTVTVAQVHVGRLIWEKKF